MYNKTIILKVDKPASSISQPRGRGPADEVPVARGPAEQETIASIKVESADLSDAEQRDLQRDPAVMASAPAMPMQLIKPVDLDDPVAQPADTDAWGITAVGADNSAFDGTGTKVAVLDTGIDVEHPAFEGITLEKGVNVVDFTGEGNNDNNGPRHPLRRNRFWPEC